MQQMDKRREEAFKVEKIREELERQELQKRIKLLTWEITDEEKEEIEREWREVKQQRKKEVEGFIKKNK